jgi:hypothetical protein
MSDHERGRLVDRRRPWPRVRGGLPLLLGLALLVSSGLTVTVVARHPSASSPHADGRPTAGGYFQTRPVGSWRRLPSDASCAAEVRRSSWEPRPDNELPNHTMPDPRRVHASLKARPRAGRGAYDPRWDSWLLPRVTGHHTGTTDENIQWAACKWGIGDDLLRAIAVRESNWYQYEVYPGGRCVVDSGCGDILPSGQQGARTYCAALRTSGHDYERDYGTGRCPKTFSIAGVMSWHAPSWGAAPANQNGTFPFNRDSTAFAVDYLGSFLRGCLEGWVTWLHNTGDYRAGQVWGCVGAWFAGAWRSPAASEYTSKVRATTHDRPWLARGWAASQLPCSDEFGCPRGARAKEDRSFSVT